MSRMELNKVMLVGNLTHQPEMKFTKNGTPVTTFSIALNKTYKGTDGEMKKTTDFIRVVVWRKAAENCKTYLVKGQQVFIEGSLSSRSWETKDGHKAYTVEVVAQRVQFMDRPKGVTQNEPSSDNSPTEFSDDNTANSDISDDDEIPF